MEIFKVMIDLLIVIDVGVDGFITIDVLCLQELKVLVLGQIIWRC